MDATPGLLALVGGGEWQEGCTFDAEFLAASGGAEVLVLPTAAAYEHPERLVARAGAWFEPLGGSVEGLLGTVPEPDGVARGGHPTGLLPGQPVVGRLAGTVEPALDLEPARRNREAGTRCGTLRGHHRAADQVPRRSSYFWSRGV